ncbi:MAG TPA: DNA primase catalytic subunit PriS [Thermoplasmata archaeon]|nr:DNA primase catalytic subunit PriS [Thermoplasmata archaeon]
MAPPPKGAKADEATIAWVRDRFRRHYETTEFELPPRFARREFGFMFWEAGMMQRHQSFKSGEALRDFLTRRTPMHVYFSSAYYEKPGAPTMEEKEWLGADLVFDLDADHIERVKGMPYEAMLEEVKSEIIKIVDQYLTADFGIGEESILITFSGGRGYHIHVRDPRVWELHSHERREIVDYITGTELDSDGLFRKVPLELKKFQDRATVKYRYAMPRPEDPGWPGRLSRGITTAAERLESMPKEDALQELARTEGIGGKVAGEIYEALFSRHGGGRGIDKLRRGDIDIFSSDRLVDAFRRIFVPPALDLGKRETDEPVTSDIKRLIRMPHSLHGKTGLAVIPMTREALESFLPLRDAVPKAWTAEPTKVSLRAGIKVTMRDETFNLKEGMNIVPEHLAIFLACRGVASIAS